MKTIIPGKDYLEVAHQFITDEDKAILHAVVEKEQYAAGEESKKFIHNLERYFNVPKAFLVNSGSSALLACLAAAKEFSGDRKYVITSALGFPTTAAAIYQTGFFPWFLDCNPKTLHVPMADILECLQDEEVAGVILAHTLGFPYDAYRLNYEIKYKREDVFLIEDACDAWGAEYLSKSPPWQAGINAGGMADMAALSLYPAHQISAGEGGVVLCKNTKYAPIVRSLINWGRECVCEPGQDDVCGKRLLGIREGIPAGYDHKYIYARLGYNLKMTEFSAALGNSQLDKLDSFACSRLQNYKDIREALSSFKWITVLPTEFPERSSPFGVPILVSPRVSTTALIRHLESNKIGTRRLFGGNLLRQPAFRDLRSRRDSLYAGADQLMFNSFWIGCWPGWNKSATEYVHDKIVEFEREMA
jgi:CDP-6-deoxy-D-xylo-4-hexulose-3-dehydrase